MWLKAMRAERLIAKNGLTRVELATLFDYSAQHISDVIDGKYEADESLARQFIAAFGAEEMCKIIDWKRTAA